MYQLQVLLRKQLPAAWAYRWPAILLTWLVCAAGYGADRLVLKSNPAVQACRRLGLPDDFLYARR